jgi:hypothetical protein
MDFVIAGFIPAIHCGARMERGIAVTRLNGGQQACPTMDYRNKCGNDNVRI